MTSFLAVINRQKGACLALYLFKREGAMSSEDLQVRQSDKSLDLARYTALISVVCITLADRLPTEHSKAEDVLCWQGYENEV